MRKKWVLLGGGVVVCLALAAVVIAAEASVRRVPHEQQTAEDARPVAVVSSAGLERARAALEDAGAGPVERVVPSVGGALAILEDGVVAVDPDTGKRRWSYRLPGTGVAVGVSPLDTTDDNDPRQRVVLTRDARSLAGSRGHTVTLDARTGAEEHSAWHEAQDPPRDRVELLTQDSWVVPRGDRTLQVFSLESGDSSWEHRAPEGCVVDMPTTGRDSPSGVATMQHQVIVTWHCPEKESARAEGLDAETGEKVWDFNFLDDWETPPRVRAMDATALAGTDRPHAGRAIARGEVGRRYVLLDNEDGQWQDRLWTEVDKLGYPVPPPDGPAWEERQDIVVGHPEEVRYSLRLHIIDELLDQELFEPEDVPEDLWVEGADGERRLAENRAGRKIGWHLIDQAIADDRDKWGD